MSVLNSTALEERARSLLVLIDGLQIEADLQSARRTLDDWQSEMSLLINHIHVTTTNRLDSLTSRLQHLKQRQAEHLRQEILPNFIKSYHERRKILSNQELTDMTKKITQIDRTLQSFGRSLDKIGQDEKRLVQQMELLKNIQRENTQLTTLDSTSLVKRRFTLDSFHSPYVALSEDNHVLIEDDDHLVLYDDQRRLNEIPWQQGQDQSFTGAIKDLAYSNYLQQFCVLSALNFFTLDPQTSTLEKSEQLRPSTGSHFQSVACLPNASEVYLALTTSGSRTTIERWSLLSGSMIRRWYHDIFESDDRLISSIRANDKCLAICIKSQQKTDKGPLADHGQWRVDLFDLSLVRMYRGMNLKVGGLGTYVTPFDDRSWLVINGNHLWLLGEQGECIEEKTYDEREKLHNVIVKEEDSHGRREFILKFGHPAELRVI